MRDGKPCAAPVADLANLLVYSHEELMQERHEFCRQETRTFISEFICKDIASSKEPSNEGSDRRKRDKKYDSKLETLYK
jgi:hypothetical protein